jgi:uncharacterized glyoxalase superfamily protein PhnB
VKSAPTTSRKTSVCLHDGPVTLFASDASNQTSFRSEGLMLSLLGVADPATLAEWFAALADGGRVVDGLQERSWGATDGQVIDRYGCTGSSDSNPTLRIDARDQYVRRHPAL